ncbi:hypothetical protein JK628_23180 (plasmid) [Shewanella sp. KX20019]|uniref:hypothetical protein n=1 Tax=Shewanella sp. KX20019 TaxID=2803864 RepID=UPI0019295A58|nr:hypothetical protein [Shewanella sp. KX20019]QQX82687.1 hypothetical protein JK628_23180 [Shewanella sp. KX20019]
MTYDASSIRILTPEEAGQMDWKVISDLSDKHKIPSEWIKRGFEASRAVGLDPQKFVDRHILKKQVALPVEFSESFKDLINQRRSK